MFNSINFSPLPGLSSPHLQMIFAYLTPTWEEPSSKSLLVPIGNGDHLSCEVSTPPSWQPHHLTVAMVHGLGGDHTSGYMIRMANRLYDNGVRSVRINLRGCGNGKGLSKLPYNGGNSDDILAILEALKKDAPLSPIRLIGFSLGGNIVIKMAGELGKRANSLLDHIYAICPVIDISGTVAKLDQAHYWIYHKYYLNHVLEQGRDWITNTMISSILDFDELVTAPRWGYNNAEDYYKKCSSYQFISGVEVPLDILFAEDDPFIDYRYLKDTKIPLSTNVWLSKNGGHMAFIGWTEGVNGYHWMDELLLNWCLSH